MDRQDEEARRRSPLRMSSMDRYVRQMIIPGFGEEGQRRLSGSTVGIMGVGGLGSPAATYLAAAGIGRLVLADPQTPDDTNLNRQILHWDEDVHVRPKPESAAWKLRRLNPGIEVEARTVEVTEKNIEEVFRDADVLLDCLDSYPPRFVLNDHALRSSTPLVHAAVEGLRGQLTVVEKGRTPCLRCLLPSAPPKTAVFPILGPVAGVFGCLQAAEAIKLLTGVGEPLRSSLLIGDLQYNSWDTISISPAENCPACGKS
ncbi:MAG: HesA/MoeB/ThiF family protein [Methanomassiliicoccus sp.]|nr:HesA/MoeB/ThiF family protein [Methanomassiliicoccus sp.]